MNAIELDSGYKIGAWLENELTTAGVEYVREVIRGGGEVAEMWAEFYDEAAHIPPTLPNGRPIKYLVECWECQHGSPAAWGNDPCRQCPHQQ